MIRENFSQPNHNSILELGLRLDTVVFHRYQIPIPDTDTKRNKQDPAKAAKFIRVDMGQYKLIQVDMG